MSRDVVALLPMKGHSERVPGKNLRLLAGKPLYHWILGTLLQVELISAVVVDTDSETIAEDVAVTFPGVDVRERPSDLVGDEVSMHDIVARFVSEYPEGDTFLQTHSTNPLLTAATIRSAIEALADSPHDSLMTVTEWRSRFFDRERRPLNHDPSVLLRTQDLSPVYEENSNLYIAPRSVIEKTRMRLGNDPLLFPVDRIESIDIDEEIDFVLAECLLDGRGDG